MNLAKSSSRLAVRTMTTSNERVNSEATKEPLHNHEHKKNATV